MVPARKRKNASSSFKKRNQANTTLMLASMLDILMAILFFLLKNYSSAVSDFALGKDIVLPRSSAIVPPMPALQLVVTQKAVLLDDKEICKIIDGKIEAKELYRDGVTLVKLAQELKAHKDRSQYIQQQNELHGNQPKDEKSFTGSIVMQADKDLNFSVLKKIIYTAGISDYVMLKLAVLKNDEA